MRIGAIIDHHKAIAIYREAKGDPRAYPRIPDGCNTYWEHFATVDGDPAVIINQRGMARRPEDGDEELSGCSVAIALDATDRQAAHAALETWISGLLPEAAK